ncbi:MBL fold metallo-hydrolase [Paenibacillus sp. GCM10027627]|uniref:MBL fold metallo-hydrolase n=1 Tax=unclassified Paenibacillus TaxID=185978 RepID=UPI00362F7C18
MAELKLERISGNSYLADLQISIGVYFNEHNRSAVLIDSGSTEKTAKAIEAAVQKKGYRIASIIVTHGHASQLGGLPYFKSLYADLNIYASSWTKQFIEKRALENWISGHIPCLPNEAADPAQEHFEDCVTDILAYRDHDCTIEDATFSIVALPGHFPGSIGVITPDGVFYCGDALFGHKTLSKQKLLYYTDIRGAKQSLEKIEDSKHTAYILCHGGKHHHVGSLVQQHLHLIDETSHYLLNLIRSQPMTLEAIVQKVMQEYQLKSTAGHLTLAHSIVRSYLTDLSHSMKLRASVMDGLVYYYDYSSPIPV